MYQCPYTIKKKYTFLQQVRKLLFLLQNNTILVGKIKRRVLRFIRYRDASYIRMYYNKSCYFATEKGAS
jgi:hypothetical protein